MDDYLKSLDMHFGKLTGVNGVMENAMRYFDLTMTKKTQLVCHIGRYVCFCI